MREFEGYRKKCEGTGCKKYIQVEPTRKKQSTKKLNGNSKYCNQCRKKMRAYKHAYDAEQNSTQKRTLLQCPLSMQEIEEWT